MKTNTMCWDDIKNEPNAVQVLDHGFVYLKSTYGTDATVCEAARISYGAGTKSVSDDRNLIRYLIRNRHTSPVEQIAATFVIYMPLFVATQMIRHRTAKLNMYSGRYSEMPEDYFMPAEWRAQATDNKQGSSGVVDYKPKMYDEDGKWLEPVPVEVLTQDEYKQRLEAGVARELARTCLPQSQYTIFVWQMDAHNLLHFLSLRLDEHAQYEIRVYAQAIYKMLKEKFPLVVEAFDDYVLNAVTFSRMELQLLESVFAAEKKIGVSIEDKAKDLGMGKREMAEFVKKISKIGQ